MSEGAMSPQWYHSVVGDVGSALWNKDFIPLQTYRSFNKIVLATEGFKQTAKYALLWVCWIVFFIEQGSRYVWDEKRRSGIEEIFWPFKLHFLFVAKLPFEWSNSYYIFIMHSQKPRVLPCPPASQSYCPRVTVLTQYPWGSCALQTSSAPCINHRLSSVSISRSLLRLSQVTLSTCRSWFSTCGFRLQAGSLVTYCVHLGMRIWASGPRHQAVDREANVHISDYISTSVCCWKGIKKLFICSLCWVRLIDGHCPSYICCQFFPHVGHANHGAFCLNYAVT